MATNRRGNSTEPLTRSSIEAYVGIVLGVSLAVFRMTWWMRIPLFVLLCIVCVDFCWRSPFTLKYLARIPRLIVCGALGIMIAYVGWRNISEAKRDEDFPPEAIEYLKSWGSLDVNWHWELAPPNSVPIFRGARAGKVVIDSTKLRNYSGKYRLWATCFHWDGRQDLLDTKNISHTGLFDISGTDVVIPIPWNEHFFNELLNAGGKAPAEYYVLLIPKDIQRSDFNSIREAVAAGGYVLEGKGGPS
jgi:hypothetical protein